MPSSPLDRRTLLKLGGGLGASLLAGGSLRALAATAAENRKSGKFATLDAAMADTLDAMAARILPTTDTPGAREAGAVWFMDAILADTMAGDRPLIASGVADLNARAGGSFAALPEAAQDQLLTTIESSPFFGKVHFFTVAGTFTLSQYGGNRDNVGWQILGLSDRHHWQPPFGYYDRDRHGERDA